MHVLIRLNTIICQNRYKEKAEEMSAVFRDQPSKAVERAVFWTEYVVRHGGAQHLRPAERDISWITYLNIDVLALLITVVYASCKILAFALRISFCLLSSGYDKTETTSYRKKID